MSQEKQKLMKLIAEGCCEKYGKNSMCKGDRCEYCITDIEVGVLANVLIDAGYRKASDLETEIADLKAIAEQYQKQFEEARTDVAREIFDVLERYMIDVLSVNNAVCKSIGVVVFEIFKKKYTKERK